VRNVKRKRIPPSTNKLFPVLILVATLFMGVGYASINSIFFNISGDVVAKSPNGVFITNVEYIERSESLPNENYSISYADNTILKSSINLEPNDISSEVSLKLSFYNNTEYDYVFKDVVYAEDLADDVYSNSNIIYEFTNQNETITKDGGTLEVIITFKYSDINESTSNILKSILNFKFSIASYIVNTYSYTGNYEKFIVPHDGIYKLEVWGAQGGSTGGNDTTGVYQDYIGGAGGYSVGLITLTSNQELYIVVGGQGNGSCVEEYCIGGYNGGGNSGVSTEDKKNYTCSGGGATHIALSNRGILVNYESYQSEVLIVAGGGGGAHYHEFGELYSVSGGAGGGINGIDGTLSGYSKDGSNIVPNATGGSQTSGGIGGYRGANGLFGQGGSGNSCDSTECGSSGGGGGWYGGGAAGHSGTGGGSGYIGNLTDGNTIDGTKTIPTYDGLSTMIGNTGNGYAKITFIEEFDN